MIPRSVLLVFSVIGITASTGFSADPIPSSADSVEHGKGVFQLKSADVELSVTRIGGHQAPVTFFRGDETPVSPYYVSPWQDEAATEMPFQDAGEWR